MTLLGASELQRKLARFGRDLDKIEVVVGRESVPDVAEAVRGELGDLSMSRWWRGNPVQIVGAVAKRADGVEVVPLGRARGPMRVLESGRNAYALGDRRNSGGVRRSRKTGQLYQPTRRVKRATGVVRGRGTWSDAARLMADRMPKRAQAALHDVMANVFRGG